MRNVPFYLLDQTSWRSKSESGFSTENQRDSSGLTCSACWTGLNSKCQQAPMLHSTANFPSFSDLKDSTVRKTVGCRYDRVLSYFHFICRRRSSGTASEGCEERMKVKGKENRDWMSKLPPNLYTVPLFNLAIPGKRRKNQFPFPLFI